MGGVRLYRTILFLLDPKTSDSHTTKWKAGRNIRSLLYNFKVRGMFDRKHKISLISQPTNFTFLRYRTVVSKLFLNVQRLLRHLGISTNWQPFRFRGVGTNSRAAHRSAENYPP